MKTGMPFGVRSSRQGPSKKFVPVPASFVTEQCPFCSDSSPTGRCWNAVA